MASPPAASDPSLAIHPHATPLTQVVISHLETCWSLLADLQLPRLPCCRPSSAECNGLLNENHIVPIKTYRASFHARNTVHCRALCELTPAPLSSLISLYCPSCSSLSHLCLFFFFYCGSNMPKSFLGSLSLFFLPWTVAGCFFSCRSRFRFELFG